MTRRMLLVLSCCLLLGTGFAAAQKNELAVGLGGVFSPQSSAKNPGITCLITDPACGAFAFNSDPQISYEIEGAHRLFELPLISLYVEVPIVGVPARKVTTKNLVSLPPDFSSIYFTPSVKLKVGPPLLPFKPFVSVGGGLAHFRTSKQNNAGDTSTNQAVLQVGGGVDISTPLPFLGIRGEVRDFFSTSPSLNNLTSKSHLSSVYAGAAIVLRF